MLQHFFNNLHRTVVVTMEWLTLNLFSIESKQFNNYRNVVLKFEMADNLHRGIKLTELAG